LKFFLILLSCLLFESSWSQNLLEERIWKVAPRKKSIFLDSGVFHFNSTSQNAVISGIRSSVANGQGFERVVIDFNQNSIPKIYGHISSKDKKLSVDFFGTSVSSTQASMKDSKFVKSIDFISVDDKNLTMELSLKGKASFDIFYLENPGRLVIDIR
jgi:hypothetical protein